ncbi:hypothetical protein [Spongiactinospora rosea]|nr:hypothetical protein [Spongiactinospora rosea]
MSATYGDHEGKPAETKPLPKPKPNPAKKDTLPNPGKHEKPGEKK